jgi:hypothetical protein
VAREKGKGCKEIELVSKKKLKKEREKETRANFCVNAILKRMKLKENVRSCRR